jgi:hypothetical protein
MKHFYLYTIILSIFIILMSYYNMYKVKDGFVNTNETDISLDDSIRKNNG